MRPKERLLRLDIPKDAIRKALEDWSDRLSSWDEFFTAMVVLGLVIEYVPTTARFLPTSVFILIQAHAQPLRDLGGLLVIVGVAGELWTGFRSSRVETDLREETGKTISETLERATKAEERIAELNLLAEQEKQARVQLEEYLAIRDMSAEEREALSARLSEFAGQRAEIVVFPITTDTSHLAGTILRVLEDAHWDTSPVKHLSASPTEYVESGVHIQATDDESSRRAGATLFMVLAGHSSARFSHSLPDPSNPRLDTCRR